MQGVSGCSVRTADIPNIRCSPAKTKPRAALPGTVLNALPSQAAARSRADNLDGCIASRHPGHAAARMCARPAQVEARHRHAVVGIAQHRAGAEQLVEAQLAVEDVAVQQAEAPLQVERREHLPAQHAGLEVGGVRRHRVDHHVGELVLGRVPAAPIRQLRRHVLHEQAGHMPACGCQRGVERRGNQHLHHRLARPAVGARIEIGPLQVVERRSDDDARAVMVLLLLARPADEVRQLRQRHVHAERARAGLDTREAAVQVAARWHLRAPGRGTAIWVRRWPPRRAPRCARRTAAARRSPCRLRRSGRRPPALVRMRAPRASAARAIACVMAPMPPSAWPHTPDLPFTSPKQWCSST